MLEVLFDDCVKMFESFRERYNQWLYSQKFKDACKMYLDQNGDDGYSSVISNISKFLNKSDEEQEYYFDKTCELLKTLYELEEGERVQDKFEGIIRRDICFSDIIDCIYLYVTKIYEYPQWDNDHCSDLRPADENIVNCINFIFHYYHRPIAQKNLNRYFDDLLEEMKEKIDAINEIDKENERYIEIYDETSIVGIMHVDDIPNFCAYILVAYPDLGKICLEKLGVTIRKIIENYSNENTLMLLMERESFDDKAFDKIFGLYAITDLVISTFCMFNEETVETKMVVAIVNCGLKRGNYEYDNYVYCLKIL